MLVLSLSLIVASSLLLVLSSLCWRCCIGDVSLPVASYNGKGHYASLGRRWRSVEYIQKLDSEKQALLQQLGYLNIIFKCSTRYSLI